MPGTTTGMMGMPATMAITTNMRRRGLTAPGRAASMPT